MQLVKCQTWNSIYKKLWVAQYFLDIFYSSQYEIYIILDDKFKNLLGYIIFYDSIDFIDLFEIAIEKKCIIKDWEIGY